MKTSERQSSGTGTPGRRLMILLGSEPSAGSFLQEIRQQYADSDGEWFVVCAEPGPGAGKAVRKQFSNNLTQALLSGARVIHLLDYDVVDGVTNLIDRYSVNRLLIGNFKPVKITLGENTGLLIRRLQKKNPDVEITQIKMKKEAQKINAANIKIFTRPKEYLYAAMAVVITSAACFPVKEYIGYQTVGLILLILTAILSLFLGRGAVIFTAILNFGAWNFFFIPPILTFHIASFHDMIMLFANLAVAITGGSLINRLRKNQADLELSRKNITLLYSLLESLNNANSIKGVIGKVRAELDRHFDADAIVYLREKQGPSLEKRAFGNDGFFSETEFEYACLVFQMKERAVVRRLNDTLSIRYFPLSAQSGTLGVIGIATKTGTGIDEEKLIFLKSFITQITSALEREISIDKAKENQVYQESQKLFQTVLNSVSHELRTPVSIISSAVSNLMDDKTAADPVNRNSICTELEASARRLNQLIENILDMSKIDSGYLSLNLQPCDICDLVGVVVNHMKDELSDHAVRVDIPDLLPAVKIDMNWMKQALMNILRNSAIYTPRGSEISISASADGETAVLKIEDAGPGVPTASLDHLFDKFYRVPGSRSGGTGLGLTIAKALVEAHNGTIKAVNRPQGGLSVAIQLPIAE
ncbi:MAG TPA: ATP-binding protein [Bacteroidales bacterium]|nr:ATP-binding protein [Bacteroidales bacterium]HPT01305.1 ATP-binding protein [Bacteroidales bacterium]